MSKEDSMCPICKQSLDTKHLTIYDAEWELITGEEKIKSIICGTKNISIICGTKNIHLDQENNRYAEKAAAYRAQHCSIGGSEENRVDENQNMFCTIDPELIEALIK